MNKYCRYCCHMVVGDANYCTEHNQTMSEAAAKAVNRCGDFVYNPIDAFGTNLKGYQPREHKEPKKTQCDGQMSLFGKE